MQIVYVTRLPPSPSGVARYAADFRLVLQRFGVVSIVEMPSDPSFSQRLATIANASLRLLLARRRVGRDAVCWVELAGRGIAELFGLLVATYAFKTTCVTIHDAPAVTGGLGFVSLLDRPGARGLAQRLTAQWGVRVEGAILRRCTRVWALSRIGAEELSARYDVDVACLRHVVSIPTDATVSKHRRQEGPLLVYIPGYVAGELPMEAVVGLLESIAEHRATLLVGAASPEVERTLKLAIDRVPGVRCRLLGFQSEEDIDATFARADIVARPLPRGGGDVANRAAVSGPIVRAAAHACVTVTNDARGTSEYLNDTWAVHCADPAEVLTFTAELLKSPRRKISRMQAAAKRFAEEQLSPDAVVARLSSVFCE